MGKLIWGFAAIALEPLPDAATASARPDDFFKKSRRETTPMEVRLNAILFEKPESRITFPKNERPLNRAVLEFSALRPGTRQNKPTVAACQEINEGVCDAGRNPGWNSWRALCRALSLGRVPPRLRRPGEGDGHHLKIRRVSRGFCPRLSEIADRLAAIVKYVWAIEAAVA